MRSDVITALDFAKAWLELNGIPLPDDLAGELAALKSKRRDKREPARREKEEAEQGLFRVIYRLFRKQRERVRLYLEMSYPWRKSVPLDLSLAWDELDFAALVRALQQAFRAGVNIFKGRIPIQIDYSLTNAEAAEAARKYAYNLVKGINTTTMEILQRLISGFIETPGATIRDVMDMLPFDEERALMIATTEITRSYAAGEMIAGQALKKEFPDVKIKKRWFTSNDDRTCELCGPLDNMEVDIDEGFTTDEDKSEGVPYPPLHPNCRCFIETYTALAEL